jgi:hypothetical protein
MDMSVDCSPALAGLLHRLKRLESGDPDDAEADPEPYAAEVDADATAGANADAAAAAADDTMIVEVCVLNARNLRNADPLPSGGGSDPYLTFTVTGTMQSSNSRFFIHLALCQCT